MENTKVVVNSKTLKDNSIIELSYEKKYHSDNRQIFREIIDEYTLEIRNGNSSLRFDLEMYDKDINSDKNIITYVRFLNLPDTTEKMINKFIPYICDTLDDISDFEIGVDVVNGLNSYQLSKDVVNFLKENDFYFLDDILKNWSETTKTLVS